MKRFKFYHFLCTLFRISFKLFRGKYIMTNVTFQDRKPIHVNSWVISNIKTSIVFRDPDSVSSLVSLDVTGTLTSSI